ncbi:unnamed protein product [Ilex paraguariensis]|uniref:F-box domain-containing protein n=1 Tax=Ilex paraguariensis TaxID=185542 RepID=A0ABC8ULL5_9AQUA
MAMVINEGEFVGEDEISCLPTDLILCILEKLLGSKPSAKSLCQLSLISKRFYSVILRSPVFLHVPKWNPSPIHPNLPLSQRPKNSFCDVTYRYLTKGLANCMEHSQLIPMLTFLRKLSWIHSLFIEVETAKPRFGMYHVISWNAVFKDGRPFLVLFCFANAADDAEPGEVDEEEEEGEEEFVVVDSKMYVAGFFLVDVFFRLAVLRNALAVYPKLRQVEIGDTRDVGRIVVGEEEIVAIRGFEGDFDFYVKSWYEQAIQVQLPSEVGHDTRVVVLREVTLLMLVPEDHEDDYESIGRRAFEVQDRYNQPHDTDVDE